MTIAEHFQKGAATVAADATALEAARLMDQTGLGCLVVLEEGGRPAGVVTDRDLTLRVAAEEREPAGTPVREIMSSPARTAGPADSLEQVLRTMQEHGIRRLPVWDEEAGKLCGMVTFDDLLVGLSKELSHLGETVRREMWRAGKVAGTAELLQQITGYLGWSTQGRGN